MRKLTAAAVLAAVLFCTGCTEKQNVTSYDENAPLETTQQSTAPAEETVFSDYDDFSAEFKEQHPDSYELPVAAVKDEWDIGNVSLGGRKYNIEYNVPADEAADAETVEIDVAVEYTVFGCASMEAYYQAQNYIPDSHVYEKTDDYLIRAFDDGRYTIYFLAGENNTICTITIDQPELSAEECARMLLEYRDKLGTE